MVCRVDLGLDPLSQLIIIDDEARTLALESEDDVLDDELRVPLLESLDGFRREDVDFHWLECR
jgi:hypothetical protein